MGIVKSEERKKLELEEFRRMLLACGGDDGRKDEKDFNQTPFTKSRASTKEMEDKLVCVTSGVSFLGLAIVNRLLNRGYSVRVIVDNPEDVEKIKEIETWEGTRPSSNNNNNNNITTVAAKLTEIDSLTEAFHGCRGIFHTSSFIDPFGLSGYTKCMTDVEVKTTENVIKACTITPSVKKCVLTSSLLACIWLNLSQQQTTQPVVINHDSWSDESICIEKKLWYALAKLRAEKAAWKIAEENGLKMATICPGLITGPKFCCINPTATFAYLKGAQEMYESGLLATVNVNRLAEAHVCVFEAMNKTTFGRYICFDQIIQSEDEAEILATQTNLSKTKICGTNSRIGQVPFQLSDHKLVSLMSASNRPCYSEI